MLSEETPKKSKEKILQEEASLAEAIRLDSLQKEEEAKQIHLDSLLAQRIAEEEELNEQQKKRKAQVQFEAQHYTNEDWDLIRAKIEANAELSKSMLGSELQGEDFAKKMVDLVNQRKKYFAEERARAKRNKPMTQSQLKTYMMGFDKLVKQVESFAPISFEATKASLKRFGEELQTKTPERLKDDEAKDDVPTKKSGKRRKQMARKGLHTSVDDSEGSSEDSEKDDSTSGTKIPINPVPVATKSPSIANYKIIKQGRKGVYQIVRENGTDMVYISFGAMLTDISRDDLTELYRIVMKKHGMNEPEDEFEKVLWEYLKNMFEEPLSTDSIWSLPGQQRIICWRYYDACRVHCLNLESADVYMLIERKYPLSAEVCKAMLDKKLQGGKPDEDCYKLLKMMEKQAALASPRANGYLVKATSNPLIADDLLKIIWVDDELHDLSYVKNEFPAIVINDTFAPQDALQCKSQVSTPFNDEIDFRISFDESDDEDYTIIYDKNSFSYKMISINNLKMDSEKDNEKVIHSIPSPESAISCFDDFDFLKDFENEFPAIVYNDVQTSKSDLLTEPTLNLQHIDELNLNDETSMS
ncbi:hypothetical protein Tco_0718509 [Tanacetum coccineum]